MFFFSFALSVEHENWPEKVERKKEGGGKRDKGME